MGKHELYIQQALTFISSDLYILEVKLVFMRDLIKIIDKIINPDFIVRYIRHPKESDYPSMPAMFITHIPSATAFTHFGDVDSCIDKVRCLKNKLHITDTTIYVLVYSSGKLIFNDYVLL